jgi:hypothetical protein
MAQDVTGFTLADELKHMRNYCDLEHLLHFGGPRKGTAREREVTKAVSLQRE